jgi:hypothetical protein
VTDEARERWREQHRAKRIRERRWGPAIGLGRSIAFWLLLALSLGVLAVCLFVAWGWGILAFAPSIWRSASRASARSRRAAATPTAATTAAARAATAGASSSPSGSAYRLDVK